MNDEHPLVLELTSLRQTAARFEVCDAFAKPPVHPIHTLYIMHNSTKLIPRQSDYNARHSKHRVLTDTLRLSNMRTRDSRKSSRFIARIRKHHHTLQRDGSRSSLWHFGVSRKS